MLGRNSVKKKPIDSFDACEDYFALVTEALITSAAMKLLGMSSLNDTPSISEYLPQGDSTWTLPNHERNAILDKITNAIIESFISLNYNDLDQSICGASSSSDSHVSC